MARNTDVELKALIERISKAKGIPAEKMGKQVRSRIRSNIDNGTIVPTKHWPLYAKANKANRDGNRYPAMGAPRSLPLFSRSCGPTRSVRALFSRHCGQQPTPPLPIAHWVRGEGTPVASKSPMLFRIPLGQSLLQGFLPLTLPLHQRPSRCSTGYLPGTLPPPGPVAVRS
jgi:hypothetical protein